MKLCYTGCMWTADTWQQYTVLDASDGEKLEDWGGYLLVRPDPQVIWSSARRHELWRSPDAIYHRSPKGGGEWELRGLPASWEIHYFLGARAQTSPGEISAAPAPRETPGRAQAQPRRMTFRLKPFRFKHTGVFPEQAVNWELCYRLLTERAAQTARPPRLLNLFAYTGGATLAAALAGASVTHVDASRGMVSWARENAAATGLASAPIRWLVDDCTKFLERELRRGHSYDAIIMDPPSYGRGPGGEVWKMEDDIFGFTRLAVRLLSDEPLFLFINSYTTGLQPGVLRTLLSLALSEQGAGSASFVTADELGLPIAGTDLILPQGATARFVAH